MSKFNPMTTEQDVERVMKAIQPYTYPTEREECAKAALSAMPNKHEKAVKVLREALETIEGGEAIETPPHDNRDTNKEYWMRAYGRLQHIAKQALATVDEMMGE